MGCVQQAVLEFDEEVQSPWRPRLVSGTGVDDEPVVRPLLALPSRRNPSRVGVCRPAEPVVRVSAPRVPSRAAARVGTPASRPARNVRPAAGRPGNMRLRLTRRARRLAVVLALAAGVALGSWLGPLLDGGERDLRLAGVSSVVVQPGDTLWSIAGSLGDDGDVRAVVDRIQELNDLGNAPLQPGQVLQLP
jgi:nucleoid-associated protein YgaU